MAVAGFGAAQYTLESSSLQANAGVRDRNATCLWQTLLHRIVATVAIHVVARLRRHASQLGRKDSGALDGGLDSGGETIWVWITMIAQ